MRAPGAVSRLVIKILVSAGLLIFLFNKISVGGLLTLVRALDPVTLAVAVLVFFTSNVLGSLQWHLLLASSGIHLSFP